MSILKKGGRKSRKIKEKKKEEIEYFQRSSLAWPKKRWGGGESERGVLRKEVGVERAL